MLILIRNLVLFFICFINKPHQAKIIHNEELKKCIEYKNNKFCFLLDDKSFLLLSKYTNNISNIEDIEFISKLFPTLNLNDYVINNILGIVSFSEHRNNMDPIENQNNLIYFYNANQLTHYKIPEIVNNLAIFQYINGNYSDAYKCIQIGLQNSPQKYISFIYIFFIIRMYLICILVSKININKCVLYL